MRWRKSPICRFLKCPTAKAPTTMSSIIASARRRDYAFAPKQHFDLGEALGQMDFEAAAKLSGARFVVLKKGLARLERALGQFMLDVHTSEPHNYTEVSPPLLVRDEVMFGTAQLPKFEDDQFSCDRAIGLSAVNRNYELEMHRRASTIEHLRNTENADRLRRL